MISTLSPFRGEGLPMGQIPDEALLHDSLLRVRNRECIERNTGNGIVGTVDWIEEDRSTLATYILATELFLDECLAERMNLEMLDDAFFDQQVDTLGRGSIGTHLDVLPGLLGADEVLDKILDRARHLLAPGKEIHTSFLALYLCTAIMINYYHIRE
jgi:hypothetical protein